MWQAVAKMTYEQIAKAAAVNGHGPSHFTVRAAIARAEAQGIASSRYQEERSGEKTKRRDRSIIQLANKGYSRKEIAKAYGLTPEGVGKILHAAGLFVRVRDDGKDLGLVLR